MNTNYGLPELGAGEIVLRLGMATLLGGLVGLNRELKNKPAGLRTHAVVALGSGLAALLALRQLGDAPFDGNGLSRVMQGILTGIGFLGAGVILRSESGKHVHGLTTAATIWLVSMLGVGCGMGYWLPIGVAAGLAFVVLLIGGTIEKGVHRRFKPKPPEPGDDPSL
ncbi:putative Mg2+ transporter-C (MgtC) family protein [Verrucomicrobium sp. GAS474]|nr:putative Mg2+ transporter-C (MgtC) family protein [Verrucomicrobium sp. GAS474]